MKRKRFIVTVVQDQLNEVSVEVIRNVIKSHIDDGSFFPVGKVTTTVKPYRERFVECKNCRLNTGSYCSYGKPLYIGCVHGKKKGRGK